jgi:transcriptional regulator with PAS, ATPase and Fis domain
MQDVFRLIGQYAPTNDPVLILGETGTGKELVARSIHARSGRAVGPFVDVNCAAIPVALFESELFGYERGAFTGAGLPKPGKLELAEAGTFFLDEIGELPVEAQAKLLRVLETHLVTRVGGTFARCVGFRLIAATNGDLRRQVASGAFRADLFYRLNTLSIQVPPLRERGSDLDLLIDHLLDGICAEYHVRLTVSAGARERLHEYDWPGNVRELANRLRQLAITCCGSAIQATDVILDRCRAEAITPACLPPGFDLNKECRRLVDDYETRTIRSALSMSNGSLTRAAKRLGIDRRTIYSKLLRLGLAGHSTRRA